MTKTEDASVNEDTSLLDQRHLDMISGLTTEDGQNLAEELFDHVSGEGLDTLESLVSAVEDGNIEAARKLAHRLKGMSSNLGMTRLHEQFRAIEDRAKNGTNPPLTGTEIDDLRALFRDSVEAYRAYALSDGDTT